MNSEEYTAAKLKGFNCIIKFIDGETLFAKVADLDDPDEMNAWLTDTEDFLNGENNNLPVPGIAVSRQLVKYVKHL